MDGARGPEPRNEGKRMVLFFSSTIHSSGENDLREPASSSANCIFNLMIFVVLCNFVVIPFAFSCDLFFAKVR